MPAPEPYPDDDKLAKLYNMLKECDKLAAELNSSHVTFMSTGRELVHAAVHYTDMAIRYVKDQGYWSSAIPLKDD